MQAAAVEALAGAVLDGHVAAVPCGVLVRILVDIVVPTSLLVGNSLVRIVAGGVAKGTKKMVSGNRQDSPTLKGARPSQSKSGMDVAGGSAIFSSSTGEVESLIVAGIPNPASNDKVAAETILACLCSSLVKQLDKLSRYPSFDALWLRFLHVIGYYLEGPHGFPHKLLEECSATKHGVELSRVVRFAQVQIEFLIDVLIRNDIFKKRLGLWQVTLDSVKTFKACNTVSFQSLSP